MHSTVDNWFRNQMDELKLYKGSVLEVGSLDVNGNVRDQFEGPYVGIDQTPGKGVDLVCTLEDFYNGIPLTPELAEQFHVTSSDDIKADLIVCLEMLEHDKYPWMSVRYMRELLKPGGTLLLSTRGIGFGFHAYPIDCTRWTVDGITALFNWADFEDVVVKEDPVPGVLVKAVR